MRVENSEKSSEALKIQSGQIEKCEGFNLSIQLLHVLSHTTNDLHMHMADGRFIYDVRFERNVIKCWHWQIPLNP
jgi:hypothetical protein